MSVPNTGQIPASLATSFFLLRPSKCETDRNRRLQRQVTVFARAKICHKWPWNDIARRVVEENWDVESPSV
jgi:hypothetical protein